MRLGPGLSVVVAGVVSAWAWMAGSVLLGDGSLTSRVHLFRTVPTPPEASPPAPHVAALDRAHAALHCEGDDPICVLHRTCLSGQPRVCTNAGTLWSTGRFFVDGRHRRDPDRAAAAFALGCYGGDELGCRQLDGLWADDRAPYRALILPGWRAAHRPYPWSRGEWRSEWGPLPRSPYVCG